MTNSQLTGRIIKDYCGYSLVDTDRGIFRCRQRGKNKTEPMAGDQVEFQLVNEEEGRIERILPRKNCLTKPPVANLDQMLVVVSFLSPEFQPQLLDRHLVSHDLPMAIVFNKQDLKVDEAWVKLYRAIGYSCVVCSTVIDQGLAALRALTADKVSVQIGPSGVGKSSIINALCGQWQQRVERVSQKIQRGKQTTRFVQFFQIGPGAYLVDTPGFQLSGLPDNAEELMQRMPELKQRFGQCRFNNCLHRAEPGCIIRVAVGHGDVAQSRYDSYLQFLGEIEKNERQKY